MDETIREMAETNHRLHPWNLNMIPGKFDGWKTTHSPFWDWTIFRGEVFNFQGVPIGTPPGGTYRRKPWQVLAPPCTVFNEVYLVTELCDADLHTVINSDTPLSTWVFPRFWYDMYKDVQLLQPGKTGCCWQFALGNPWDPSCSCFDSWNLRRRSCAIFRISHSQSTIVPWHWHQMGHATHPTPKKWHPTFGHKTDIFVPITLIRCKQMQWGICTLRMLCTGIWNPWMFWPLGSAFIFCYQRLNFNQVLLWTYEAHGFLCFQKRPRSWRIATSSNLALPNVQVHVDVQDSSIGLYLYP